MKNSKKGFSATIIPYILFGIVFLVAMIPVYLTLVGDADASVLTCENPALPTLDTDYNLCTNGSGVGVVNGTATHSGLTGAEETILGLGALFLILGLVFVVMTKVGVIKI